MDKSTETQNIVRVMYDVRECGQYSHVAFNGAINSHKPSRAPEVVLFTVEEIEIR